jgi:hypothetical protein
MYINKKHLMDLNFMVSMNKYEIEPSIVDY